LVGLFGKGSKNEKTKYLRSKKSELKKLVKEKKYDKVLKVGSEILEISEFDPEALLLKANSHYELGQYKKSLICCEKIKEIDPKNKGVFELLAKIPKSSVN